jgi:hypothetical protein
MYDKVGGTWNPSITSNGGNIHCTGTISAKVDMVLGADVAEGFAVEASDKIEPGTVMVLDANGTLRASDESYDRKVAGVISGAGDYRPGVILDHRESSEGRLPLALVGKVYCKADATWGPIEIGDLLTTSPTPGHAMKASDSTRAGNPTSNVYSFQAVDKGNVPDYTGQYTATIPWNLANQVISFTVKTRNKYQDPNLWYSTTVGARSAGNYHSLGQFLRASNVQLPAGVRQFLHGTSSLRSLMQI